MFTFDLYGLLSFVCHSFVNNRQNNTTTTLTNQSFCPDAKLVLVHKNGISVADLQTFLLVKRPSGEEHGEVAVFKG